MARPQVNVKASQDELGGAMGGILGAVGGIVGGIYGGPVGAAAGGQAGSAIGNQFGSGNTTPGVDLAQKRLDKQNSLAEIQKGQESLKNMSPDMQEKFAPVLEQAMAQAQPQQQQPKQKPFLPMKAQS